MNSSPRKYYKIDDISNLLNKFADDEILIDLLNEFYGNSIKSVKLEVNILNDKNIETVKKFIKYQEHCLSFYSLGSLLLYKKDICSKFYINSFLISNIYIQFNEYLNIYIYLLSNFK